MNKQSLSSQLMDTGLFDRIDCGVSPDKPLAAYLSPAGHELLLRLGRTAFFDTVAPDTQSDPPGGAGWRLAAVKAPGWPAGGAAQAATMPRVLSHLSDGSEHRLLLDIEPELEWFEGHFPGRPILAGVVQLHLAVLSARSLFGLEGPPRRITRLKFQSLVVPPCVLELQLRKAAAGEVHFRVHGKGRDHSQGRLDFSGGGP